MHAGSVRRGHCRALIQLALPFAVFRSQNVAGISVPANDLAARRQLEPFGSRFPGLELKSYCFRFSQTILPIQEPRS